MITFDELEKCPPSHPVFFLRILLPPSQLLESTTSVSTRKFLESYMHVHPDLIEELMIFFKALLFYLPRCLWKSFEGGLMETFGRYCSFCPIPFFIFAHNFYLFASSVPDLLSMASLLYYCYQLKLSRPFLICLCET